MSALVAIVGRPNVGKSTLFNRLVGKRQAIESDVPGTTRDRLYGKVSIHGHNVLLVDTGGIELEKEGDTIEGNVQAQSKVAIDGADVILFIVDVRSELTSEDFHAADLLRKSRKSVILVANKCDNNRLSDLRFNLYELGFGEPIALSALHAGGFDVLESTIKTELKELGFEPVPEGTEEVKDDSIKIAFLGRPNVGKSTMVNALLNKERVVTSDIPGTTRDSAYVPFEYDDSKFTLIDTAGIRRRGKIEAGIEKYSILRSMQSITEADIAILLIDFEQGVSNQDLHVSQYILEEKKGLVIVVNKMDLAAGEESQDRAREHFISILRNKMAYVPWAPVVFTSALKRKNIFPILDLSKKISFERQRHIDEGDLNVWLDHTLTKHPAKGKKGQRYFKVYSVRQDGTHPPRFTFSCEWPEYMHFSYRRYLENELREQFGFNGTAIETSFRRVNEREPRRGY
jgi:GTP-binding protein